MIKEVTVEVLQEFFKEGKEYFDGTKMRGCPDALVILCNDHICPIFKGESVILQPFKFTPSDNLYTDPTKGKTTFLWHPLDNIDSAMSTYWDMLSSIAWLDPLVKSNRIINNFVVLNKNILNSDHK